MECSTKNVVWAPFPELTSDRMNIRNAFSFRAVHALWAEAIAPHLSSNAVTPAADCGTPSLAA